MDISIVFLKAEIVTSRLAVRPALCREAVPDLGSRPYLFSSPIVSSEAPAASPRHAVSQPPSPRVDAVASVTAATLSLSLLFDSSPPQRAAVIPFESHLQFSVVCRRELGDATRMPALAAACRCTFFGPASLPSRLRPRRRFDLLFPLFLLNRASLSVLSSEQVCVVTTLDPGLLFRRVELCS